MKRWTMILLVACAWPAAKASVEITVTGDPPLPVRNLLEADNPGFEQGFEKKSYITAEKMLAEGLDIKMISRITGLSKKQINNLKKETF